MAAHALSRAVLAYPLLAYSPVHDDGLGAQAGKPTDNDVWLTHRHRRRRSPSCCCSARASSWRSSRRCAAIAAAWFASRWIAERLGGYTGDTLGAVQQKAEIVFLVVARCSSHH